MELPINSFKRALKAGQLQIGLWSSLASHVAAEVIAGAGFDWLVIDAEHGPNDVPIVLNQLQAMAASPVHPIVRPPWNDAVVIKRLLDVGVQTLLVPFVQTAEEAARAVAATRYPPHGIRGVASVHRANRYGRVPEYFARANGEMCVLVQLETRTAVEALEEIAAVDGVDAIFIGPSDLAASFGHLGNNAHPEVRSTIEQACRRAQAIGTPIGILAPIESDARAYLDMGFAYVAVGSDVVVLRKGCDALVKMFKGS